MAGKNDMCRSGQFVTEASRSDAVGNQRQRSPQLQFDHPLLFLVVATGLAGCSIKSVTAPEDDLKFPNSIAIPTQSPSVKRITAFIGLETALKTAKTGDTFRLVTLNSDDTLIVGPRSSNGQQLFVVRGEGNSFFGERGVVYSNNLPLWGHNSEIYNAQAASLDLLWPVNAHERIDLESLIWIVSADESTDTGTGMRAIIDGNVAAGSIDFMMSGERVKTFLAIRDATPGTIPSGYLTYTGKGALKWAEGDVDHVASGDVALVVSFEDRATGSIGATYLHTPDNVIASFDADFDIDRVTGAYSSDSVRIITNGSARNGQLIGIFDPSFSTSAGAILDSATAGDIVNGIFAVVADE